MIVCFYIEVEGEDQTQLEQVLRNNKYAFLDATEDDPYTDAANAPDYPTLEDIEINIKGK